MWMVYLVFVSLFDKNLAFSSEQQIHTAVINAAGKENTTVSIYYESLGTKSVRFILEQFYPAYLLHEGEIDVDLVPFGKAKIDDITGTITCHHGPMECYGNKVQACAVHLYSDKMSTEFIVCAMKSGDASVDDNLEQCAMDSDIHWSEIKHCINSGKGQELLLHNGIRTFSVRPKITSIPTVIFNNVYDEVLQKLSIEDFQQIIHFLVTESDCTTCHRLNGIEQFYSSRSLIFSSCVILFYFI